MKVLQIENVSKTYNGGKDWPNKDINFHINAGEIVGFLGMNGAGKTTLLKCMTGIHIHDKGKIIICGAEVDKDPKAAKQNLGYVPDNHATFENLTGREYVNFMADVYAVNDEDRNKRIKFFLDKFSLAYAFDRQIKSYSHGMKQKIALMAGFIHNPKLWLLDEPMVGLDVKGQLEVLSILEMAREEGNSVFFSSHHLDTVEKLCDRAIVIKNGVMVANINIEEFKANNKGKSLEDEFLELVGVK